MSKQLPKTCLFFLNCQKLSFFQKKNANEKKTIFGNFFEKMSSFWQFSTVKWQVSVGSGLHHPLCAGVQVSQEVEHSRFDRDWSWCGR